jgi:hypothetical protein
LDGNLYLQPAISRFRFKRLSIDHFIAKPPRIGIVYLKLVYMAPNGLQCILLPPNHSWSENMNVLIEGKTMPVAYSSKDLFVPEPDVDSEFPSRLESDHSFDSRIFWNQIDDKATILQGIDLSTVKKASKFTTSLKRKNEEK